MARNASKLHQWATRLDRFRRSGKSLAQFCRDEDVSIPTFYYWRKRIEASPASHASSTAAAVATDSAIDSGYSGVRFTIQAGAVKIECHSNSLQAIDVVLSWAARRESSGFQQLIVQG